MYDMLSYGPWGWGGGLKTGTMPGSQQRHMGGMSAATLGQTWVSNCACVGATLAQWLRACPLEIAYLAICSFTADSLCDPGYVT